MHQCDVKVDLTHVYNKYGEVISKMKANEVGITEAHIKELLDVYGEEFRDNDEGGSSDSPQSFTNDIDGV